MTAPRLAVLVSPRTLPADALAGFLGAVLALPQGIAFATLAGMPPEYGIYTAIVPCIVAALFGSSRYVVSGPTNANSLALLAALAPLAVPGTPGFIAAALAVTAMVGLIQLALGLCRLGWVTDFVAPPVLAGFMSGAALLIGLYALPDALGIAPGAAHGVAATLSAVAGGFMEANPSAVIVAACTLVVTIVAGRLSRRLPYMLIGVLAGYGASELLVRYLGLPEMARAGTIPSVLPPLSVPVVPLKQLEQLAPIAAALSIVALGQSVSIAKALARRSGEYVDVDREFVGQGLSNIAGAFFSSYVSCGSLNRSLPNYLAGARTPMAAVLSALFLVVLAFVSRPLLERLPLPAIAALLLYIAAGLIDLKRFAWLWRVGRADFAVAVATLAGMLALPFQHAILIGSGLALAAYLHRTAHPAVRALVPDERVPERTLTAVEDLPGEVVECPQLKLLRIEGSLYFGAASHVARRLQQLRARSDQKHLLVMVKSMNFIDLAGVELWTHELAQRRAAGGDLNFHRPRAAVLAVWERTGFVDELGADHIFGSKREAIAAIYPRLDATICARCTARIFRECRACADGQAPGAAADQSGDATPPRSALSNDASRAL
ncbi:SulP family inorganic anion transporter [Ancylobacter mangrovi]|uniref:SulP family inorganic anion transporter n=1 Tax=Ancylobacter mangrovi TaxID=2972472 RepID=UPI002162A8A3|nr:SulP family inorganic anion transporter [Ancylobacter mangrovi]MCS0504713.1 SulP family inorganic anion transporter [Ancylobacter mangrovi]